MVRARQADGGVTQVDDEGIGGGTYRSADGRLSTETQVAGVTDGRLSMEMTVADVMGLTGNRS